MLLSTSCKEPEAPAPPPVDPDPVEALPVTPPPPPEKEGYALATGGVRLPAGCIGEYQVRISMVDASVKKSEGGSNQVGKATSRSNQVFTFEVKGPDEVHVTCKLDRRIKEEVIAMVPRADPPEIGKLQGQTVIIKRAGEDWEGKLSTGSEATWEEAGEIQKLIDWLKGTESHSMFGGEPREIGEEWDVDPNTVPGLDPTAKFKGNYRLKFSKIGEFNGLPCAVLEGRMDIVARTDLGLGSTIEQQFRGSVAIYRSIEHQIDLSTIITGELVVAGGNPHEGVSTTVRGNLTIARKTTLALPKEGK